MVYTSDTMAFYFAGPIELDQVSQKLLTELFILVIIGMLGFLLTLIMWTVYIYKRFVKHKHMPRLLTFNVITSVAVGLYIFLVFVLPNFLV